MTDMQTSVQERDHDTRADATRQAPSSMRIELGATIQSRVIPRLHAAMRDSLRSPRHPLAQRAPSRPLSDDVPALAENLLATDPRRAYDRIDALRQQGRSLDRIYLDLLAPVACHLRDLWSDDLCGLADVTIALCNLQGVLRHYATDFYAEAATRESGLRALLVSPSEKRSDAGLTNFGLILMSEFFRREGWNAWIERDLSGERFRRTVVGEWFDMVEVLATSDKQLDEISSGIKAIRRGSPNPAIGVIVCGQVFIEHPEFVRLVGADLVASDPLSSLALAKSHIANSSITSNCVTNTTVAGQARRERGCPSLRRRTAGGA